MCSCSLLRPSSWTIGGSGLPRGRDQLQISSQLLRGQGVGQGYCGGYQWFFVLLLHLQSTTPTAATRRNGRTRLARLLEASKYQIVQNIVYPAIQNLSNTHPGHQNIVTYLARIQPLRYAKVPLAFPAPSLLSQNGRSFKTSMGFDYEC